MSYLFPTDTCVIACSGPSLNKVDVFSLGLPVCAISTAIRTINNPDYWFIADHLNEMHGEEGKIAWENENITKVVPERTARKSGKNILQHPYREGREANRQYEKLLFDPSEPLLRGPHKTLTFAIQWLHVSGVRKIIFAGNDLDANNFESKYSYKLQSFDNKKQHNFKKTLDQIKEALVKWYPVAKQRGFEWYSWECGPVFEEFVPRYTPDAIKQIIKHPKLEKKESDLVIKIREQAELEAKKREQLNRLSESDRNRKEYRKLLKESREINQKESKKINMTTYFDLLHKRKK